MKLFLLAGTKEARDLASLLVQNGISAEASLANVTRNPIDLGLLTRMGGFGGEEQQSDYLKQGGFQAIIDATHPFAQRISTRSHSIAQRLKLPYLRLLRPEWQAQSGDDWHFARDATEVTKIIPPSARVFLATGAQSIEDWRALAKSRTLFCRRIDPAQVSFPYEGAWLYGRGPFSYEDEIKLLKQHNIDWIVMRNSGGITDGKIQAARRLNLPIVMISRPDRQVCETAHSAQEALEWINTLNL